MEPVPAPGRALQPLRSLRRHRAAALAIALVVIAAGIPLAWIKGRSFYTAEAVFQVFPSFQKNVSPDKELELQSNSQYREFVNHLSRSVLRQDVVRQALAQVRQAGLNPCTPAESDRQCIERLQRTVLVLPMADTYMVRVALQSNDRNEPHQVVNALMDVFLRTARHEQIFGWDERTRALIERREALGGDVAALSAQRDALAARLGLTSFGENTTNPFDGTLAQLREKASLAALERSQAQAALAAFEAKREAPLAAGRSVLDMRLQDNGLQALRNEVVRRSEELGRTTAGLEARHPARAPALAERDEIQQRLQARESDFEQGALRNVRARLQASLMQAQLVEREAQSRLKALESQAGAFATDFREAMRLTADIRKRNEELNEVRDRLNFLQSERQAIGFVRLVTPALAAETPQGLGRLRLLLAALAAAAVAAVGLPMLLDLLDPRVRMPRDAEKAMGIPAAGWVADQAGAAAALLARDQTRRLASTLLRERRRGGRSLFGFTSARVGGGTTALVHQLAADLALLGSRVLVVDANTLAARDAPSPAGARPDEAAASLCDLLAGRAGPGDVVVRHDQAYDVVPFGAGLPAGIERLDRLRAALGAWQAAWDLVLVDLPPLLASADTELLIEEVAHAFLVVEAGYVRVADVRSARAVLQRLDPQAVGLIVNRVPVAEAGAALRTHLVEQITGKRFDQVVGTSTLRLRWQAWRAMRGA